MHFKRQHSFLNLHRQFTSQEITQNNQKNVYVAKFPMAKSFWEVMRVRKLDFTRFRVDKVVSSPRQDTTHKNKTYNAKSNSLVVLEDDDSHLHDV